MTDHLHSPASTETGLQRKITAFTGLDLEYSHPGDTIFVSRREPTFEQMDLLHHLQHHGALQVGESNVRHVGDGHPAVMLTGINPAKLSKCIADLAQDEPMLRAVRPALERYTHTLWRMGRTAISTPASDQSVIDQIAALENRGMLQTRPYPGRIVVIKVSARLIMELNNIGPVPADASGNQKNVAAHEPELGLPAVNLDQVITSWRKNNNRPEGIRPGIS
jgi:hypothetical protein